MNLKLTFAAMLIVPMMLTACAKKDEASQAGQESAASTAVSEKVTPEQQAAIDAIDKPVLDLSLIHISEPTRPY